MGDRDYFRQEFTGAPREPFWATYPATKGLIIGLIGVHLLLAILKAAQVDTWLAVYTFLHLDPEAVLNRFYVWQLFTYAILHGSVMHLLLNCVMLYFLGRLCEQRMGKKRFISFCALAALAASMAFLFWMVLRTQLTPMVGASGIAMGLTVLAACWYPRMTILFFFVIPMQLWVLAALLVVVDLMQALSHTSDIAHTAHLGGALYGFIYFRYGKRIEGVFSAIDNYAEKRQRDKARRELKEQAHLREEVDRILDKVNRDGMAALTEEERRFLKDASARLK